MNRPTRRTTMLSPSSCHSRVEPGPTPSFRRTAAGTEICPCAVRRDWAMAISHITAVLRCAQARSDAGAREGPRPMSRGRRYPTGRPRGSFPGPLLCWGPTGAATDSGEWTAWRVECSWCVVAVLALLVSPAVASDRWPQFRGEGALGISREARAPVALVDHARTWPGPWRVPGHGWSSPVVWGDTVYVTAAISPGRLQGPHPGHLRQRLHRRAARPGPCPTRRSCAASAPGTTSLPDEAGGEVRWMLYGLDAATGEEALRGAGPPRPALRRTAPQEHLRLGDPGHRRRADLRPRGQRRPLRLLARGPPALVAAARAAALLSRLRHRQLARGARGAGAGPPRQPGASACCSPSTRRRAGSGGGPRRDFGKAMVRSSFTTPFVWKNSRRTEIVTVAPQAIVSYDLEGRELWRYGGSSMVAAPTPVADGDLLFVGCGLAQRERAPAPGHPRGGRGRHLAPGQRDLQRGRRLVPGAGRVLHHLAPRLRLAGLRPPRPGLLRRLRRGERQAALQGPLPGDARPPSPPRPGPTTARSSA